MPTRLAFTPGASPDVQTLIYSILLPSDSVVNICCETPNWQEMPPAELSSSDSCDGSHRARHIGPRI